MSPVLIPVLAQALMWSAGDRLDLRLRGNRLGTSFDLVTTGQVQVRAASSRATWDMAYRPSVTVLDFSERNSTTLVQHAGNLGANLQLTPRASISFSESAAYGEQHLQLLALTAPQASDAQPNGAAGAGTPTSAANETPGANEAPGANAAGTTGAGSGVNAQSTGSQVVPTSATIRYGSSNTGLRVSYRLESRWRLLARVGYSVSGGLDDASRQRLPRMITGSAGPALSYMASLRDRLSLGVDASRTTTNSPSLEREAYVVSSGLDWDRTLSRNLTGGLSVGLSYAHVSTTPLRTTTISTLPAPSEPFYRRNDDEVRSQTQSIYPTAAADVRMTERLRPGRLSIGLLEQVSPFVDRMTGVVVPRSLTQLDVTWTKSRFSAMAGVNAIFALTESIERNTLRRSYGLNQVLTYSLPRNWQLEAGARQLWVSFADTNDQLTWIGYAAVAYTTGNQPL